MRKKRSYSLIFGQALTLIGGVSTDDYFTQPLLRGGNPLLSLEAYYNENDPNAYLITEHEVSFRIRKSEKKTNNAEITIDNLSEGVVNYLLSNKANNLVVALKVGYDGDNKLVFQGTMKDCLISKTSDTGKTKLVLEDGKLNTDKAYSSRTYPAGTPAQDIVDDLITDLAFPKGGVVALPVSEILAAPLSFMGNSMERLKRLLSGYDYSATVNEGSVYITPKDKRLAVDAAFISPATGLIGSVVGAITSHKPNSKLDKDISDKKSIRFTCQIDATLRPTSSVYVQDLDSEIDGSFKITDVTFLSSSKETGSWIAVVDAIEIEATVVV